MRSKVIFIDIDGTICDERKTFDRPLAVPLFMAIEKVNELYEKGNTIVFWTARGWEQYNITKHWLLQHGFKHHQLMMGKPIADMFIDDRAIQFKGWNKFNIESSKAPYKVI
jgi:uncharacterized HAD superfamily protein